MTRRDHRPGLTRLHNPDPAETAALNAEAARFAQRRVDEAALAERIEARIEASVRSRPTLRERLARLWRRIRGRG